MTAGARGSPARSNGWRLFLTVWLVYSLFATTNVVRETYLAITLGEDLSVRVDKYHGLHPDLFEMPGRGWYINSNPGASMLGAIPYAILVRPGIALATRLKPSIAQPKPPATYDDPRPNRTLFLNRARERGLDVVLGLAALGTGVTLMAPLGALTALLLFAWRRERVGDERKALAMSLLYAFATPALFRTAFINQNAIMATLVLGAWVLKTGLRPRPTGEAPGWKTLAGIGLLLGFALVCDYSAIPFLVVFGCWILFDAWKRGGPGAALHEGATYTVAALTAIAILFAYQWIAFGNPIWPAQRYMPPTEFSVRGWFGFTVPTMTLLIGNLFDPRYGVFAFSPLLLLAMASPFVKPRGSRASTRVELGWIAACVAGLLLFSSANQFANLQWNTGVRYMVPAVPLLFLAALPAIDALPRPARWAIVAVTLVVSFAVTMTREAVPDALRMVFSDGPTLPILLVLQRTSSGYDFSLPAGAFWIVAAAVSLALLLIWRPALRRATT